jgi:hypothetical protein
LILYTTENLTETAENTEKEETKAENRAEK